MPRRKLYSEKQRKMRHTVLQISAHKLMETNNDHDDVSIRKSEMKTAK